MEYVEQGGKHCYGQMQYGVNKSMIRFITKNEDKGKH